ncbi:MAG: hypothetical protein COA50_01190 [Flavobacteriaceae bacterium]|nr:MAG: hypothetical protein COA50_01190 [Flavobacteriaceae bacterium]
MDQGVTTFLTDSIKALTKKQQMQIVESVLKDLDSNSIKAKEINQTIALMPQYDISAMAAEIRRTHNYKNRKPKAVTH